MTEHLPDVWATRDFPLLREITRQIDAGESNVGLAALADATGLTVKDVTLGVRALLRRNLVECEYRNAGVIGSVNGVSGQAYLLTGLHPDGDDAVSNLVSALRQAADEVGDPEEKGRLRKMAEQAGTVSRDVLAGVLAAVITASTGIAGGG